MKAKAMAKVAAVATGLAMATSMLALAPMAHAAALTGSQISAIVSLLQSFGADSATIANVQASLTGGSPVTGPGSSTGSSGASASCSAVGTMDLHMGSTGAGVSALQSILISGGFLKVAAPTGYFGALTKSAVMAWQTSAGVSSTGYFGALSRAALMASATCTASNGGGNTGGNTGGGNVTLSGVGRLTNLSGSGNVESDLKEGDKSTSVVAVSADVKDGDVQVQRVEASLYLTTSDLSTSNGGSSSVSKYVESVDLYINGDKVASMDASAGDKNGREWTYRFTNLNSGAILKKGTSADISIHVTPVSSIGQDEDGADIQAVIPDGGIRVVDATGISDTYGVSGDEQQEFTVSTATTGKLTVSEASSNPDDTTVKVDANNATENVNLLTAQLRAKNQDITVTDLPVQICIDGSTPTHVSDVVQSVRLMNGSTSVKSKTISTSDGVCSNVVFDSIDKDISQDSNATYSLQATLKKQDGNYDTSGDTLVASTTNDLAWDVTDNNGDSADVTGGAQGGTMTLQTTGITIALNGTPGNPTVTAHQGDPDTFTSTIKFDVTAGDDDIWISNSVASSSSPVNAKVTWTLADGSTGGLVTTSGSIDASGSTTNDSGSGFKVNAGSTRTFTLTVTGTGNTTGLIGTKIIGIGYDTDSTVTGSTTVYTTGLSDFKTPKVSVSS